MKKFLNVCIVFILSMGIAVCARAGGEGHHPNWHRYGFVSIPLTSFLNADGTRIDETPAEGTVSAKAGKAAIGIIGGKPAIVLGPGPDRAAILATFRLPDDYWRGPTVEALAGNNVGAAVALKWSLKVSTASTLDTAGDLETDVTATADTDEKLTFTPNPDATPETFAENTWGTFEVQRNDASTATGKVMRFYDFVFRYEKKTDS